MTESAPRPAGIPAAFWPACTSVLAIVAAITGTGFDMRRSAIGWMIGSWGARLAVQGFFAPLPTPELPLFTSYVSLLTFSILFAVPALISSHNPDPSLSTLELAASVAWVLTFAGETTADRQRLRFAAKAEHAGFSCRTGMWRWTPYAHAICETAIWIALAVFATASPWGWFAWACPAARLYLLTRRG